MKTSFRLLLLLLFGFSNIILAQNNGPVLKYTGKVGFFDKEDRIVHHGFIKDNSQVVIIGEKSLQIWDVNTSKLLHSVPHRISQFSSLGFVSEYVLLKFPRFLNWRPFLIDKQGKWIITIEKIGENPLHSAVVRELDGLKQIAVLDLPNVSTEYISFSEPKNEILTFGITNKNAAFSSWNADNFTVKVTFSAKDYKWHQTIYDDTKAIVGSGDTKFSWTAINDKQGDTLTLRDIKSGAIEKEYTAANLEPATSFQDTVITNDEKFIISQRNERIFVWEIAGSGQPKFEVSQKNPQEKFSFKSILDKRYILAKIGENICLYDAFGDGTPKLEVAPRNEKEDLKFVKLLSNRYAVIKADKETRIYDIDENNRLKFEFGSNSKLNETKYIGHSKNEKFVATLDDQKISVYDVSGSEKPIHEVFREHDRERFPFVNFLANKDSLIIVRVNHSEKKDPRMQYYELPSGKMNYEANFAVGYDWNLTPDEKYFYKEELGAFFFWSPIAKQLFQISLKQNSVPSYDHTTPEHLREKSQNIEFAQFSPDYKYIVRFGHDLTAVFDPDTGEEIQRIFDKHKVQYDKHNKIKKSGLEKVQWTENGKILYAFEKKDFWGNQRAINLWQVVK